MTLATRTVVGTVKLADNTTAASGTVIFAPNAALAATLDALLIPARPITLTLSATGTFTTSLVCTNAAGMSPTGWAYTMTVRALGDAARVYTVQIPSGAGTLDMATVTPMASAPALVLYVLAATVGQVGGPAGPLDGAGKVPSAQIPSLSLKSGWWYPADGQGGSRTMTYQLLWIYPFDLQRAVTLTRLACNVTSAGPADAVIRLGVYGSDGAGGIGNLIVDGGAPSAATTGVKTATISQATGPDRIWLCGVWQGSTTTPAPVLQAYSRALPYIGWSSFVQFPPLIGYQFAGITGALPATLPTPTANENNNVPAVQFSIA